jgi:hypothetical protein
MKKIDPQTHVRLSRDTAAQLAIMSKYYNMPMRMLVDMLVHNQYETIFTKGNHNAATS